MVNDNILEIRDSIINAMPIEKLYLFGSYEYGTPHEDSDYDFYMVIPNNSIRPLEAMERAFSSVSGLKRKPMDVLAGTAEMFERRAKGMTLERKIAEEGILLYEKS